MTDKMPDDLFVMSVRKNPYGYNHYVCTNAPMPNEVRYIRADFTTSEDIGEDSRVRYEGEDIVQVKRGDLERARDILEVLQRPLDDTGDWRRGWNAAIGISDEALSILETALKKSGDE